MKPGIDSAMHLLGNERIEVEGNTVFAESYLLAFRASRRGKRTRTRTRARRFVDRFNRRGAAAARAGPSPAGNGLHSRTGRRFVRAGPTRIGHLPGHVRDVVSVGGVRVPIPSRCMKFRMP